jgi:hypothetical protein
MTLTLDAHIDSFVDETVNLTLMGIIMEKSTNMQLLIHS